MNKEHKDREEINLDAPRLPWFKQKVRKKHQNTVFWVDIKLAHKKGFKFYQTRSNADNWMKELGSEVAGGGKDSNKPNQRPKIQLLEQGDLFCQSNNPVRVFRKSNMFLT